MGRVPCGTPRTIYALYTAATAGTAAAFVSRAGESCHQRSQSHSLVHVPALLHEAPQPLHDPPKLLLPRGPPGLSDLQNIKRKLGSLIYASSVVRRAAATRSSGEIDAQPLQEREEKHESLRLVTSATCRVKVRREAARTRRRTTTRWRQRHGKETIARRRQGFE